MKLLKILFCMMMFLSCITKKESVQIELLNKELYFVKSANIYSVLKYKSKKESDNSFNVIKFKITNNTDRKLLFFVNDYDFSNFINLRCDISSNNISVKPSSTFSDYLPKDANEAKEFFKIQEFNNSINDYEQTRVNKIYASKMPFKYLNYLKQRVVLNPGESRIFKTVISLPLIKEKNLLNSYHETFYKLEENEYKFKLIYEVDKGEVSEYISAEDLEDLKNDKIHVFEGKIESNDIKLIQKKM